ncbi:MAG: AMP-binding protein [Anaerolineales bacterium]|nr:AMP-binding protein [Anaerolineales bacterium]
MSYQTLIQPVIERAGQSPDHLTLVMVNDDGSEEQINARQFHDRAVAYAKTLTQIGVGPDDLVILVLKHSQVLLSAFWGALYLGAIPSIFPFLTEKLDPELYMQRVQKLVAHSGTKAVITFPEFKGRLSDLLADVDCKVLSTDEVPAPTGEAFSSEFMQNPRADKIAFLQHSSGTTGLQKGVALTHQAVLNQVAAYSQSIDLRDDDVVVSWLPLYHDMGLIAGFVMPIVSGTPLVLMSPFHWIRDPKILMHAIHNHQGALCWLPNFAYNHLARTVRPRFIEGVDLSSWRMAINCSEPVYHTSHEKFLKSFSDFGFQPEALATCYAMAENTFAVTQSEPGQPPRVDWVEIGALQAERQAVPAEPETAGATAMVSCGQVIAGTQVAVVDADGNQLPERQVGEIILKSDCMLREYYRRPEVTAEAIQEGWYHTGDMGYLADGHLYVSGRKKDLIIVGGKNVYPQDLEAIANETSGLYPGRAVAFGLFDERVGSETIVMVCELLDGANADERAEIERQLRQQIVAETEVTLADVRLVEKRWLIKTSSGKIARGDNRQKYLAEFRNQ